MALPYIELPPIRSLPIQPYGMILLIGMVLGTLTMWRYGRRLGIRAGDTVGLAAVLVGAAFVGGHLFDVAFYQWERAMSDSGVWLRFYDGHSLFGALLSVGIVVLIWTDARALDRAVYADVVAIGCLVAMTFGRIGCALVHDHPGTPTDSLIGVDFPADRVGWLGLRTNEPTIRLHDLGLEELVLLLPVLVTALVLARRRLRAGMVAAIVAIAYPCVRFGLDFLRHPQSDPRHAGLTAAQWCCIMMLALGIVAVLHLRRFGQVAPLAAELGGQPGGRRRTLPKATAR